MFEPGEKFESFEIIRSLGKGGMGQVFLARDTKLDRKVALKLLTLDVDEGAHGVSERFHKEAKILAAFDHPNIVKILTIGEYQGSPYLVMEYIEGDTLLNLIAKEELDLQNKMILIRNLLIGLQEAHSKGVLHRDIKPANIILDSRTGMPKILDFGISKDIEDDSTAITNAEVLLGTVSYMAPEQIQGGHVSQQSDIFSMGVLFYELLTGENPFKTDNKVSTMYNICNKNVSVNSDSIEELPAGVAMIVDKMLSKDLLDRYYSVEDILNDFDNRESMTLPNSDSFFATEEDEDLVTREQALETLEDLGYNERQVDSIMESAALEIETEKPGMSEFMELSQVGKAIEKHELKKPSSKLSPDDFYMPEPRKPLNWKRVGITLVMVMTLGSFYLLGDFFQPQPQRQVASVQPQKVEAPKVEKALPKLERVYLVQLKNMDTGGTEQRYRERLKVVSQSDNFYYGKLINEKTGKENTLQFVSNPFLPPLRKVANAGEAEIRNVIRGADSILPVIKGKKFRYYIDEYTDNKKVQFKVLCHAGETSAYRLQGQTLDALEIQCIARSSKERRRTHFTYSSEHNLILREERFLKINGDRYKEIRELIKH